MSEHYNEPATHQKNALIQDVAKEFLDGDKLKNLLDFLEFLKSIKLTPRRFTNSGWNVKFKGKIICRLRLYVEGFHYSANDWCIQHDNFSKDMWFVNYEKYFTDEEMIQFVWNHIQKPGCPRNCQNKMTILGKEFHPVCYCRTFMNTNPSGVELERSKKLILIIKAYIADLMAASKS